MALPLYCEELASSALHTWLASKYEARMRAASTENIIIFTTYPQVVSYLLRAYTTDENITKDEVTAFSQPRDKNLSQYSEELIAKTLHFGIVYNKYSLSKSFIKWLDKSISHSIKWILIYTRNCQSSRPAFLSNVTPGATRRILRNALYRNGQVRKS